MIARKFPVCIIIISMASIMLCRGYIWFFPLLGIDEHKIYFILQSYPCILSDINSVIRVVLFHPFYFISYYLTRLFAATTCVTVIVSTSTSFMDHIFPFFQMVQLFCSLPAINFHSLILCSPGIMTSTIWQILLFMNNKDGFWGSMVRFVFLNLVYAFYIF